MIKYARSPIGKIHPYLENLLNCGIVKVDLLLASPMRRTIQTALTAFSPVVERGLRVLAVPSAQEATAENSDVGSDVETIKGWFGDRVDLSLLKPGWNDKVGDNACDVKTIMSRARQLRTWIKERPEKEIVLVSHGRFAHYLTGEVDAEGVQTTAYWINDEFRTYEFVDDASDPGEAMIAETEEGRIRREQVLMEKMAEPSQP